MLVAYTLGAETVSQSEHTVWKLLNVMLCYVMLRDVVIGNVLKKLKFGNYSFCSGIKAVTETVSLIAIIRN
jgi:hypothetical protein